MAENKATDTAPFSTGDVVRLKGNTTRLVVESAEWSRVETRWLISVAWLETSGGIHRDKFEDKVLDMAGPP